MFKSLIRFFCSIGVLKLIIAFDDHLFVDRLLLTIKRQFKYKLERIAVEDTSISVSGEEIHLFRGRIYGLSNLREIDKAEVQLQLPNDFVLNVNVEARNVTFNSTYSMKKSKFVTSEFRANISLETVKIKTEILINETQKTCQVVRIIVSPIKFIDIKLSVDSIQVKRDFQLNYPKSIIRATIDYSIAQIFNEALKISCFNTSIHDGIDYDVIIIGGGIAGLSAAEYLIQNGIKNIAIFEAKSKLGGRIQTVYTPSGAIEIGAQWIYSATVTNNIYNFANLNGLLSNQTCEFKQSDGQFVSETGEIINKQFVNQVLDDIESIQLKVFYKECNQTNDSKEECLNDLFKELLDKKYSLEEKDFVMQIFNFWKNENLYRKEYYSKRYEIKKKECDINLEGGTDRLIEILSHKIGKQRIFLNTEVLNVKWSSNEIIITVKHKGIMSKITTNFVICTVSIGVLKERESSMFNPRLPQRKVDSITNLKFEQGVKIIMFYEKPFWRKNELKVLKFGKNNQNYDKGSNDWINRIYFISETVNNKQILITELFGNISKEVESINEFEISEKITDLLRNYTRDATIPKPIFIYKSKWCTDPFIRGLYAVEGINSTIDSEIIAEGLPEIGLKRLFFAGEALSLRNIGTMNGARESGINAAIHILRTK